MADPKLKSNQFRIRRSWFVIAVIVLILGWLFLSLEPYANVPYVSINDIVDHIQAGNVNRIAVIGGTQIIADLRDGRRIGGHMSPSPGLVPLLTSLGVTMGQLLDFEYEERPADNSASLIFQILLSSVPILLITFPIYWFMRTFRRDQEIIKSFSRTPAEVRIDPDALKTRLGDVGGMEQAKQSIRPLLSYLREPDQFLRLGANLPNTVLLVGPPGSGKTWFAKAIAGEVGLPLYYVNGSEFLEMFVGVGAARVRDLFKQAKEAAPALIFIDELDAIGQARADSASARSELQQTMQQLLVELDGLKDTALVVIGASNRPDLLDPALVRSGRFDQRIVIDAPDVQERAAILAICTRGNPLAPDVDLNAIAAQAEGMVAADLARLVNEAAMIAALGTRKRVTMRDFEDALQRLKS